MSQLRFTLLAESDLLTILEHIAKDTATRAIEFVDSIPETCELIATQPEMGRVRREYPGDYRCHPFGNYLIFYRVAEQGVEIHRVLHAARNVNDLL